MAGGEKHPERSFWKLLRKVQAGPNLLGNISQVKTTMNSDSSSGKRGQIAVKAVMTDNGYNLEETTESGKDVQIVYWLPWKDTMATSAKRSAYESSDCNFFMTTALTGCRFTLTPTLVVHVAHSAYAGTGTATQGRSLVEEKITGPRSDATFRAMSGNPQHANDISYTVQHKSLVFGMKNHDSTWTYKLWRSQYNDWTIMG